MKKYLRLSDSKNFCYEVTNICPMCNTAISPIEKTCFYSDDSNMFFGVFECPACHKGFISHYIYTLGKELKAAVSYVKLNLQDSYPKIPRNIKFDDTIIGISPNFCEIYNQAYIAEQSDLDEIAGIGYRKSLEFLIKDYCIFRNPKEKEKVKESLLGQVINNYLDSDKIKNLAKASAWLGNDETHYVRKYEDKDIGDLKRFITATVAYISYEITAENAQEFVNN